MKQRLLLHDQRCEDFSTARARGGEGKDWMCCVLDGDADYVDDWSLEVRRVRKESFFW